MIGEHFICSRGPRPSSPHHAIQLRNRQMHTVGTESFRINIWIRVVKYRYGRSRTVVCACAVGSFCSTPIAKHLENMYGHGVGAGNRSWAFLRLRHTTQERKPKGSIRSCVLNIPCETEHDAERSQSGVGDWHVPCAVWYVRGSMPGLY